MDVKYKRFNINDYNIIETIGSGLYGKVKLAQCKLTNETSVIKILRKNEIIKLNQVDHVYSELLITSANHHPFIVSMQGFHQDTTSLYFLLEYLNGGNLFEYLRKNETLTLESTRFFGSQITVILDYLHSKNIIYRDLKPENLMFNEQGYLKLIDFGFAKKIEGKTYTLCGTPNYMSPEIIFNKGHSFPSDWWSLGILLYELIVGFTPFYDEDTMIVYQKIIKGKYKFPKNLDRDIKSLIKHLLVADVNKRFGGLSQTHKEIYEHRFFKGTDFKALVELKLRSPYEKPKKTGFLDVDTSNFSDDSPILSPNKSGFIKNDPFINW